MRPALRKRASSRLNVGRSKGFKYSNMNKHRPGVKALALLSMFFIPSGSLAAQSRGLPEVSGVPAAGATEGKPFFKEIGVLVAYGATPVEAQREYVVLPAYLRLGIDMDERGLGFSDWVAFAARSLFNSGFRPKGRTQILFEPFAAYVPSPASNLECGFLLVFRYEWPEPTAVHPYVWNGIGGMYRTQHLYEQGSLWAFTPEVGMGLKLGLSERQALDLECRYRHFSTANLRHPNHGVNQWFYSIGISQVY